MFCSRCGKTIPAGAAKCPGCGLVPDSNAFSEGSYIGTLPAFNAQETPVEESDRARFARVSYTSIDPSANDGEDKIRRTGYRPAFRQEEETKDEAPAADIPGAGQDEAGNTTGAPVSDAKAQAGSEDADEIELPDSLKMKPLTSAHVTGISRELRTRMQAEAENTEGSVKTPQRPKVSGLFSPAGRGAATKAPKRVIQRHDDEEIAGEDTLADESDVEAVNAPVLPAGNTDEADETEIETAEEEDYEDFGAAKRFSLPSLDSIKARIPFLNRHRDDDDDYEEEAEPSAGGTENAESDYDENGYLDADTEEDEYAEPRHLFGKGNVSTSTKIIRIVLAAVLVIALLVGGIIWISLRTAASSQVSGVTHSFFEQGVRIITSHTTNEYRAGYASLYATDPTGTTALAQQAADRAELESLIPGTPQTNDQSFLDTLLAIQDNIDAAVTLDALGVDTEGSQTRWDAISNAVAMLSVSSDAGEFGGISDASEVKATEQPEPTPTISPYTTLTKGMYNNPEVKKMQQRLYELGWFNDVRDGDFGSGTQTAVKAFQQASGLSVTGIADGETLDAMYAENAIRTGNRITAAPADPNAGTAENAGE